MNQNPLQKYFRQPKLFISLPSKGLFYKQGVLEGDYNNVPIFPMTGMDEIIMKTPDALFNGESTVQLIESCCPYIKDARGMPSLDIDAVLVAIRLATYGNQMTINHTCKNCGAESPYEINLTSILDNYADKKFDNKVAIGEIQVNLKPLSYQEMTAFNIENFKLQKMLGQLSSVTDETQKQAYVNQIYQQLGNIQVDIFMSSIESVQTPEELVTDKEFIKDWLKNTVNTSYQTIKDKLESNKNLWQIPKMPVQCPECEHEDFMEISMDQSNFFG
jgi:DNA-binding protein YbaB